MMRFPFLLASSFLVITNAKTETAKAEAAIPISPASQRRTEESVDNQSELGGGCCENRIQIRGDHFFQRARFSAQCVTDQSECNMQEDWIPHGICSNHTGSSDPGDFKCIPQKAYATQPTIQTSAILPKIQDVHSTTDTIKYEIPDHQWNHEMNFSCKSPPNSINEVVDVLTKWDSEDGIKEIERTKSGCHQCSKGVSQKEKRATVNVANNRLIQREANVMYEENTVEILLPLGFSGKTQSKIKIVLAPEDPESQIHLFALNTVVKQMVGVSVQGINEMMNKNMKERLNEFGCELVKEQS